MRTILSSLPLLLVMPIHAAIRTWDGGDSLNTNWTDSTNWSTNVAPVAGDSLVFPSIVTTTDKATNNNFAVLTDFAGLTFSASDYSVAGNEFDLVSGGIVLSYSSGTTTITPVIRLTGAGQSFDTGIDKPQLTTGALNLNGNSLSLNGFGTVEIGGNIVNSVGTPTITKLGAGKAVLGGFNSFSGNVLVNVGTLFADGFVAGAGTVTVAAGATLAGSNGGITKTTTVSGTLAPGSVADSTQSMSFETLTFASTSTTKKLSLNILGTTAGTNHDQVEIGSATTLDSAALELDFGPFVPAIGQVFTLINNTSAGAISGTFSGIANASSSIHDGQNLRFSYVGGTGNDFTATVLNALPVAAAQSVSTNEDTALPITLTATDANGQALNYSIVTNPTRGVLTGSGTSRTYTPNANLSGPDSFTFKANDGTADSAVATVSITVNPVNDLPSFTKGSNQTVAEDAIVQLLGWATAISDGDSSVAQALSFNVTNDNNSLFAVQPAVSSSGALSYTPAPNAVGTATVSVSLTDDATAGGAALTTAVQIFTIILTPVNDTPTFVKGVNQTVNEDAPVQTVAGWATSLDDGDPEVTQTLSFGLTNPNNALFSVQPAVSNTGTLTYTPAANANGTTTVTVTLTDDATAGGAAKSSVQTFTITISPVNDVPIFLKGNDQTVNEDVGARTVPAWATAITDNDSGFIQLLTFNVTNDNNALFSAQPAVTSTGTLSFTPAANVSGTATVSVSISDDATAGGAALTSAVQTFTITVAPANDVPSFVKGANQTVNEDAGAQTVAAWATSISDGDPETVQTFSFTVTNNNAALFASAPVVSPAGTLTFTPAANANGSATVSVSITDDATAGGAELTSAVQTFTLTVTAVNDLPSFVKGGNQTVVEDSDAFTLNNWATSITDGDAGIVQELTFNVTNDNNALFFVQPSVTSNGSFSFLRASNAVGTATVSVSLTDDTFAGGGALTSAVQTFSITITPVNDAPSFVIGANQTVDEDAGPQSVTNFATSINDGDPEVGQALNFNVTNNNTALFAAAPTLSPTGTLTYTTVANASGSALVTVTLTDDATAGGAALTSFQQFFTITVNSVNDPPVANAASFVVVKDTTRSLQLTGSDVEGSALTFTVATPPTHGSFEATVPPNLRYTPAPGYIGPDSFTFRANDGNSNSPAATVSLNIVAADTATWDGGGINDNWSTPQNWIGDTLPVEGCALVFPDDAARRTNLNDLPVDFVVESITIAGNGYDVGFIPGGALSNRLQLRSSVRATGAMPTSGASLSVPLVLLGPCVFRNEATALNGRLVLNKSIETNGHQLTLDDATAQFAHIAGVLLQGSVTGGGKVTLNTAGTVECSVTNFWTGGTEVRRGMLIGSSGFSVRGPLTIGGGAGAAKVQLFGFDGTSITMRDQSTLDALHSINISDLTISSANSTIFRSGPDSNARIFVTGGVQFEAPFILSYPITFTNAGERAVSVAASVTANIEAPFIVSNGTRLVKTGSGTLKLRNISGNSSGLCEARQGTLTFFNSHVFCPVEMNGGEISIEPGVTASVASLTALASGGRMTFGQMVGFPGNRVATMPVAAGTTLNAATTLRFPLEATCGGQGAGSTSTGRLEVSGLIAINGAALQLAPLENFFPAGGETFTLMTNDGNDAIVGTFAGVPEGQIVTVGNRTFRCSYVGGDGNDFTVTLGILPTGNTRVWTGGGNNNLWTNAQNWAGNLAPVEGDGLEIPDGALRTTSLCDFPQGMSFNHFHVGAPSHSRSGNSITLMGGLSRHAPGLGDVQLGIIDFIGTATVETTGFGLMTVLSTLRTAEMLVTTGANSVASLAITPSSAAALRKLGTGTLTFQHGTGVDPQLLPPIALSAEAGTLQVRAFNGNVSVGGQGAATPGAAAP